MENMQFVNCPLCGKNKPKEIYHHRFRIVRCIHCGFKYINPRNVVSDDTENDYAYYQTYLNAAEPHKILFNDKFDEFLSQIKPGKILDVGCSTGEFLDVGRERGWETVGVDVSEWVCNFLKKKGYQNIYHGTLEEIGFPYNEFDVVHLSHVLEHIYYPHVFLKEVNRILKTGGYVIIEVPNETWFPFNYKMMNLIKPLHFGKFDTSVKHLSLFSKKNLIRFLEENRFSLIVIREEGFTDKRVKTPIFQRNTIFMKIILALCRFQIDRFIGLGRYLVAVAQKK